MPMPPIGASGVYKLAAPFQNKLLPNTSYRCEAVRRIADLVEQGIDPYEEFYQPNGLSRESYDRDVSQNAAMCSLVSQNDHWLYVPSSYIQSYPNVNGIPYSSIILGVSIGPIPNYMDLAGLRAALSNVVQDSIGVTPEIKSVVVSPVTNLSQQDHDSIEATRQSRISNTRTDRARAIKAEAENQQLRLQIRQLEDYIRANTA